MGGDRELADRHDEDCHVVGLTGGGCQSDGDAGKGGRKHAE